MCILRFETETNVSVIHAAKIAKVRKSAKLFAKKKSGGVRGFCSMEEEVLSKMRVELLRRKRFEMRGELLHIEEVGGTRTV